MEKYGDIWTLELVSIQAFHRSPEKSGKPKQLLLLKIICSFVIKQFPSRTSKFLQVVIQNSTLKAYSEVWDNFWQLNSFKNDGKCFVNCTEVSETKNKRVIRI